MLPFLAIQSAELAVDGGEAGESDPCGLGDAEGEAFHEAEHGDIEREERAIRRVGGGDAGFGVGEDPFDVGECDEPGGAAVETRELDEFDGVPVDEAFAERPAVEAE